MHHSESNEPIPLFLHIPKCGGSTISHIIYQQCRSTSQDQERSKYWHRGIYFYPAGLFSQPSSPSNPNVARMLHRPDLRAVVGHFSFGLHHHVSKSSLYITSLRNPIFRILSLYDELKAQNRVDMPLEEFICKPPFAEMENDQTRRIAGFEVADQEEEGELMLEKAKANLQTYFGVVGITERMNETVCLMHQTFGWTRYELYYPKNVTLNRTLQDSVAPHIMRMIAERNDLDFRLYRFAEDLFQKSISEKGPDFQMELNKYNQALKNLIEQTDVNSMDTPESKKIHGVVLDMMQKRKIR